MRPMDERDLKARRFLEARFDGRAQDFALLGLGEWSRAYALRLDGRDVVVRFGPYREDFEKDRVMAAYSCTALPIPEVLEVGAAPRGFYCVSARVPGESLEGLDLPGVKSALPDLLETLEALRAVDIGGTQGFGYWSPNGRGENGSWAEALLAVADQGGRIAGWRDRLEVMAPGLARTFDRGVETLRRLAPKLPDLRHIVHGDILGNVLVDEGKLRGVIDWGNAMYGDPLYDIAWLLYWWPWFPAWQDLDLAALLDRHWQTHGGPPALAEDRLRCCLIQIGLSHVAYCAFKGRREDLKRNAEQLSSYL